jgi:hypothetical protein
MDKAWHGINGNNRRILVATGRAAIALWPNKSLQGTSSPLRGLARP